MRRAVLSAKPDVIVHEMTDLKGVCTDLRHFDRAFAVSNRLRTQGTDHLLAAAKDTGVKRFVAQSFRGWSFARVDGAVESEEDPLDPEPPEEFGAAPWTRSGIWKKRSRKRPRLAASCLGMARSMAPIPVCSTMRSSSR